VYSIFGRVGLFFCLLEREKKKKDYLSLLGSAGLGKVRIKRERKKRFF
jgi:hypothetical protein